MIEFKIRNSDPFFCEEDIFIVLPHNDDFSDGSGRLTAEMAEWLAVNAINAQWTYRAQYNEFFFVVKFTRPEDLVLFKLRWT